MTTSATVCGECGGETEALWGGVWTVVPTFCRDCANAAHLERVRIDEKQAAVDLLQRAGGTRRLLPMSLETYPKTNGGTELVKMAREYVRDYRIGTAGNLFLFGAPGCGKTGLAWGIIREVLRTEFRRAKTDRDAYGGDVLIIRLPARLVDTRAYLESLRRAIGTDQQPDTTPRRLPLVVLDDLGAERETEWAVEALGLLIAERYERELPTIVTSNYAPSELADRLDGRDSVDGGRLMSRLLENATAYHLTAPDRRLSTSD